MHYYEARFNAIERTLVNHFEATDWEVELNEMMGTWEADRNGFNIDLTELARNINEAIEASQFQRESNPDKG